MVWRGGGGGWYIFPVVISPKRKDKTSPKIFINLPLTYKKLHRIDRQADRYLETFI